MAAYKYTAIDKDGEKVSGIIEGYDEYDAVQRIKQTCNIIVRISEVKKKKTGILSMEIGKSKLNEKAFTLMCSQFAVILKTGVPVGKTVHLIADRISDKKLKSILNQVAEDVESGQSMSASFRERSNGLMPTVFIETIAAGEEAGNLAPAFQSMYEHFDKEIKMKSKVKSAMSYPLFILGLSVAVVMVLMAKVVPTFTSIFAEYDSELPMITKSLVVISRFFQKYILEMLIIVVALLGAYAVLRSTEKGRTYLAQVALNIPIFGNIQKLSASSEFANNLATLLISGLPITRAVSIMSKVIGNYYISQEVGKISEKLEAGKGLGECMREIDCLPDILVDMTAVGEESGELEKTLITTGAYYDVELDTTIQSTMKKLEPTLLIIIAVIASYIVLAVYIAMFQMYTTMG